MTTTTTTPLWFIDNLARVRLDGEASGGAIAIVESTGRRGDMPPLHVHHREDEVWHVLAGRLSIHLPGGSGEIGPGEAAFGPRGVPHTYRVESPRARWLVTTARGDFERFVRSLARPAESDDLPPLQPPTSEQVEHVAATAAAHGIELVGPPLEARTVAA